MRRRVLSAAVVAIGCAACSLGSFDDVQGGAAQGGAGGTQDGSIETSSGGVGGVTSDAASEADAGAPGVMFDAESHGHLQGMGPVSVDVEHSVGTEPNRLLLVIVHVYGNANVDGVKYAGVDMGFIGDAGALGGAEPAIQLFSMVAPPTGKHLVAVSVDVHPDNPEVIVSAVSFSNVDQDAPLGDFAFSSGEVNTPISVDIPSSPQDLVLAGVTFRSFDTPASPNPGQTMVYSSPGDAAFDLWGAASLIESGEVTGWQHPDGPIWAAAGVPIHPPSP